MPEKVIVIGAGLAGLSAAYHLKLPYEIYEKEGEVGGLCRSLKVDGFIFDQAIHIFYTRDDYVSSLVKKLLGKSLVSQSKSAWVYSRGVLTPYPFQANTYGLPQEVVKECIMGLIKVKYESDSREVKNFEDWVYATFGEGIAKHFMLPFNRKMWGVDLREMSFDWIKDRVLQPSLEEVIAGALGVQEKPFGPNAQFLYPREGGIGVLPRSFLPYLKNVNLRTEISGIGLREKVICLRDGRKRRYDFLISSLPLPNLINLIDEVPPQVRKAALGLKCNSIIAINLGVDRERISDKHWIYFPEDKYIFHRLSFPMNFSPGMAPKGKSSLTVEVSTTEEKKIDAEGVEERVREDLIACKILREKDRIIAQNIIVLRPAYIIYDHKRKENLEIVHKFLRAQNIYPCGRFGEWEYLNMDHSILSGKRVAEGINRKFSLG